MEKQADGSYTGIAFGKVVNMKMESPNANSNGNSNDGCDCGDLVIDNCTCEDFADIWHRYLDLDRDYNQIKQGLSGRDKTIYKAMDYGYGIRILKQDLWETIISFIISQNNNIPRIKGCIENLAKNFGEVADTYKGKIYYNLPSPEKLASLTIEDLAPVRLGYRAKYLIETAKLVLTDGMPYDFDSLSCLCGVGPKVANCVSLFGLANYDSFPIDVWVKRVMFTLYNIDEKNVKEMQRFATENFSPYGGIAQQYLFYYMRSIN